MDIFFSTPFLNASLMPQLAVVLLPHSHPLSLSIEFLNASCATRFADDADIAAWAKGFAAVARQNGITSYILNNRFEPKDLATRAETLTAILNMLDLPKDYLNL